MQYLPNVEIKKNWNTITNNETLTKKTSLFRLNPFLLAFQRFLIYEDIKTVEEEGDRVLKVKVDGIYTGKMIN